jgi:hypothetical protein
MSHVDAGVDRFEDTEETLTALEFACRELGLELVRGATRFQWFGRWVNDWSADTAAYRNGIPPEEYGKCVHLIRFPLIPGQSGDDHRRPYELGLYKLPDGRLVPVLDTWSGGSRATELAEALGAHRGSAGLEFKKLSQGVAKFKALALTARLGGRYVKGVETTPDGKTIIRIGTRAQARTV